MLEICVVARPSSQRERVARELDISQPSAHRIPRKDLDLTSYKIQTFQALGYKDVSRQFDFADFDDKLLEPHRILFTDAAHFHLDGYVNKKNYRIWGTEEPSLRTKPLHPKRITTWAGMFSKEIVGPIFVDNNLTINGS